MLELMEFYVSGFWVWLGLTVGLSIIVYGALAVLAMLLVKTR